MYFHAIDKRCVFACPFTFLSQTNTQSQTKCRACLSRHQTGHTSMSLTGEGNWYTDQTWMTCGTFAVWFDDRTNPQRFGHPVWSHPFHPVFSRPLSQREEAFGAWTVSRQKLLTQAMPPISLLKSNAFSWLKFTGILHFTCWLSAKAISHQWRGQNRVCVLLQPVMTSLRPHKPVLCRKKCDSQTRCWHESLHFNRKAAVNEVAGMYFPPIHHAETINCFTGRKNHKLYVLGKNIRPSSQKLQVRDRLETYFPLNNILLCG